MWTLFLSISIIELAIGFALGYGVRARFLYHRERQAEWGRTLIDCAEELPINLREAVAELNRVARRHRHGHLN